MGRTQARIRRALAGAAVLVGTMGAGVGAGAPAGAADLPDIAITALPQSGAQVGAPFTVAFTISNLGSADAASTRLDVVVNHGEKEWTASPPFGCTTFSSSPPFPQAGFQCPTGPLKAGQSITRTYTFTSKVAGTFTREAFAYVTGSQQDANRNDDGTSYGITVAPATGGGGGGGANPLAALLAGLLSLLHL